MTNHYYTINNNSFDTLDDAKHFCFQNDLPLDDIQVAFHLPNDYKGPNELEQHATTLAFQNVPTSLVNTYIDAFKTGYEFAIKTLNDKLGV
jgi:hypothetical protein